MLKTEDLTNGLRQLGHDVSADDVARFMRALDPSMNGQVPTHDFAAS